MTPATLARPAGSYGGVGIGIAVTSLLVLALPIRDSATLWILFGALSAIVLALSASALPAKPSAGPCGHANTSAAPAHVHSGRGLLLLAYTLEGIGYIVSATFIVAVIHSARGNYESGAWAWVVVGLAGIPACVLWTRPADYRTLLSRLALGYWIQASGIVAVALAPASVIAALISAATLGATLTGIVMLTMVLAPRLDPEHPRRTVGQLTIGFSVGQMLGPVLAGYTADFTGSYGPALLGSAALLVISALATHAMIRAESKQASHVMTRYDRTREDVSNIVHLEHVNVTQPDQRLATLFYVAALGLTRDPYLMVGLDNMWINIGRSQMHLPSRDPQPQRIRGTIGLVLPDLAALKTRLEKVAPALEGTQFSFADRGTFFAVTCPWGNRFRCHAPAPEFGATDLAMAYVELDVPPALRATHRAVLFRDPRGDGRDRYARRRAVGVGVCRRRASGSSSARRSQPLPPYDGHHIQIYIADFSGPHRRLRELGLITKEADEHEWRFMDIVDLDTREVLFTVEHEVRSLKHPLYGAAARQPQSGADQPRLRPRPGRVPR